MDHPVCYLSRKCNIQSNYSIIKKEALGMFWALKQFDVYVGGGVEVLVGLHNPLTFSPSQH